MWMHYSAQSAPKVEDIKTGVARLCYDLNNLSMDALHATNYDLSICFNDEEVSHYTNRSERYARGSTICNQYCQGEITLEQFCERMMWNNLKYFLYGVAKYLPDHIIEKYQLQYDDGDEDLDDSNPANEQFQETNNDM